MVVVLENTNYEDAIEQPFSASLIKRGELLTNFAAEAHPSQPNYIALVSGSIRGVTSDANVDLDQRHLGDLLEAKGLQWKVYAEGYPGGCYLGAHTGTYVRKHVPFLSFKNGAKRPSSLRSYRQRIRDGRRYTRPEATRLLPRHPRSQ
jgi:acid phosphatase